MPTEEEKDRESAPDKMTEDEFNERSTSAVNEFMDEMTHLINEYTISNELAPNHRLLVYLYTGLSMCREISKKFWGIGSQYMEDLTEFMREEMKNDAD